MDEFNIQNNNNDGFYHYSYAPNPPKPVKKEKK